MHSRLSAVFSRSQIVDLAHDVIDNMHSISNIHDAIPICIAFLTGHIDVGCSHIGVCISFFAGINADHIGRRYINIVTSAISRGWCGEFVMELHTFRFALKVQLATY